MSFSVSACDAASLPLGAARRHRVFITGGCSRSVFTVVSQWDEWEIETLSSLLNLALVHRAGRALSEEFRIEMQLI